MKDKRLEEQFKGYFKGMEVPETPNSLTDDAKKYVKKRTDKLPMIAKISSIAASFVLVVAVGAVLISKMDFRAFLPDGSAPPAGDNAEAPSTPPTYAASELVYTQYSAYTASKIDPSLKLVENLAYSQNAQVNDVYVSQFADGTRAFAYADISVMAETRHDTEIFIEYTSATFEPLKEYAEGAQSRYNGISYYLTQETDETGEPVNKLLITYGGVKYYFKITSSDTQSYMKYLQMF